jgi:hypothetical protein
MTYFINKLHVAITVLLLTAVNLAYGNTSTNEECEDSCSSSSPCCVRGFISADFLYWRIHQGGFACGCVPGEINNFVNEEGNVISKFRGDSKDPHFKWNAGFRIGTGYEFVNQSWDIAAYWTHFHTHIHDQHQPNQFRWKLDYEVIDVLLGRKFCLESFTIRPFIGVRAAQIEQKVKSTFLVTYHTFFNTSSFSSFSSSSSENLTNSPISDFLLAKENNKEKFRGVGPLIGIEADWYLGCGCRLYACASVSNLYGHFNISFNGFNTFLNGTNTCDKNAHLHSCQISTDAVLGIRWQQCFCDNMQLMFQLALEHHRYFNHNHLGSYGDLCLDGISFSSGVSF